MPFVVDVSSGYLACTPAALARIGAAGVIFYTGCDDTRKNVDRATFAAALDAGYQVALVIENGERDMLGGDKAGVYLGQQWLRGAEALGYDVANCIGYTAADWHVLPAQYAAVGDAFGAFAAELAVAGLYANGPMLDQVSAAGYWNSDSTSFGAISHKANLIQRYNDPRAGGLPVDVDDIAAAPLHFMGGFSVSDSANISEILSIVQSGVAGSFLSVMNEKLDNTGVDLAGTLAASVGKIPAEVVAALPPAAGGTVDLQPLLDAIAALPAAVVAAFKAAL